MGILAKLFSGSISQIFTSVMDEIHLSPEKKAELQVKMTELQQAAVQADNDYDAKLNDIAGQNIRTDSSSADWFVRRARPLFLWVMGLAIGCSILFFPLVNLATGAGLRPLEIPDIYISIYKYALLGYTGSRTIEKLLGKS